MYPLPIFIPFAGMMLLTFVVWLWMFYQRISAMRALDIELKTRADLDRLSPRAINSAANFQNLFELPVIFYACILALNELHQVDHVHVLCAFGFFLLRIVHSGIHCTYNNVIHRFSVYLIASLFLWVMVIRLAIGILASAILVS